VNPGRILLLARDGAPADDRLKLKLLSYNQSSKGLTKLSSDIRAWAQGELISGPLWGLVGASTLFWFLVLALAVADLARNIKNFIEMAP
jgi:hypothetical protein